MATFTSEGETLNIRVLPELLKSLNLEVALINGNREIEFNGRILSKEVVLNAILCDFMSLPIQERREILQCSIRNLETMLTDRKPVKNEDVARLNGKGLTPSKRKPKLKNKKSG